MELYLEAIGKADGQKLHLDATAARAANISDQDFKKFIKSLK